MSVITELVAKFGFDVDSEPMKKFEEGIKAVEHGMLGLVGLAGGSAAALYEMAVSTAENREELYHLAQQVGMTVQKFSALSVAAGVAGVSSEELAHSMVLLNRQIFNARMGGQEQNRAFMQLGITTETVRDQAFTAGTAIGLIAERFKHMDGGPEKAALAMQLFGRSGARMIPLLNRGAAGLQMYEEVASSMGLAFNEEKAAEAEELVENVRLLKMFITGLKNVVSEGMIPAFNEMLTTTLKWLVVNKEIIKTNLTGFVRGLTAYLKASILVARAFFDAFVNVVRIFNGAENATKLFLGALGILAGGTTLFGIGKVAQAIWGLSEAFAAADLAAAAIPLAWGAAIASVVLILEDMLAYLQGRDSITGMFMEKFGPEVDRFQKWVDGLLHPIATFLNAVNKLFGIQDVMSGYNSSDQYLNLEDKEKAKKDQADNDRLQAAIKNQLAPGGPQSTTVPVFATAQTVPVNLPPSMAGGGAAQQNTITVPINIQLAKDTDAATVIGAVGDSAREGLEQGLRQANRTVGGVAQ